MKGRAKMKRLPILAALVAPLLLTGCAKCVSTETQTVQVKIVDEYYRSSWVQPIIVDKTTMFITHPATYRITVEYGGTEYAIFGSGVYGKYSERIGEYTNGVLETKKYDDGSLRYDIVNLE